MVTSCRGQSLVVVIDLKKKVAIETKAAESRGGGAVTLEWLRKKNNTHTHIISGLVLISDGTDEKCMSEQTSSASAGGEM